MTETVVGIDIGGTFTKFGIVTRNGEILAEGSISTDKYDKVEEYQRSLYEAIDKSIASIKNSINILGIGIGAPNANYYKGTIESAANLKWKGIIPFAQMFKPYFNCPVVLTNDANAAAIGEGIYGGAKGMSDYIVITLGTGVGGGIVSNGNLIYGHDGFAGEVGHTIAVPNGRECGCGRKGCLETYTSATGIKRTVFELLCNKNWDSVFRQVTFNDLTAHNIYEAAQKGDVIAIEAFRLTGLMLGAILADAVAYTSPEAIFIFGGLAKSGDLLFKPVIESFENNLLSIFSNKIKILPSGLQDKNVAILGAAALMWKELETK